MTLTTPSYRPAAGAEPDNLNDTVVLDPAGTLTVAVLELLTSTCVVDDAVNGDTVKVSAKAVAESLQLIKEKVETQKSAGVDAATKRRIDRARGDKKLDEEDKAAARVVWKPSNLPEGHWWYWRVR